MTSWVLTIDRNYPNHWEIAKQHMLWDMTTRRSIRRGDVVYFWLSRHGFIGRAEVAESERELDDGDVLPWTDHGEREYRSRFRFAAAADVSVDGVSWTEVMEKAGLPANPSLGHRTDESDAEAWLASLFRPIDEVAAAFPSEEAAQRAVVDTSRDTRKRTLAEIAVRRGQPRFRMSLLAAYGRQCAVTGSTTEQVLEAAHIFPYRGEHTNVTENGLLLRSDIHTLFDLFRLTVVPERGEYVVRVSPDVEEENYRSLDGQSLTGPVRRTDRPSAELLRLHNDECPWLGADPRTSDHHPPTG